MADFDPDQHPRHDAKGNFIDKGGEAHRDQAQAKAVTAATDAHCEEPGASHEVKAGRHRKAAADFRASQRAHEVAADAEKDPVKRTDLLSRASAARSRASDHECRAAEHEAKAQVEAGHAEDVAASKRGALSRFASRKLAGK